MSSTLNSNNKSSPPPPSSGTHRKNLSGTGSFTIPRPKPRSNSQELGNSPLRASATSPKPIRRSLSFQIPLKVSTDSGRFSHSHSRDRARSLPPEPEKKLPPQAAALPQDRFSASSIGESPLATSKPIFVAESSSSSADENTTPTEQFLQARGLPTTEPHDPSSVEALRDQVVRYLTAMSAPQSKTPGGGESDRAPQYPSGYSNSDNGAFGANPKVVGVGINGMPAQNLPMPNLSGNANGPIGNLLKGPVGPDGKLKDAALMVGIKLDLEAEVHLTARVRGDILVGLY